MIELTVKTLDSQNHSFSVEDDITVAQFKEHIAGVVNIPTDSQRLIYCGRVLQDAKKLQEYDVNGKVIHLVQRAPPSTTNRRSRSPTQPTNNTSRRLFQGPVYLGSMALPSGIMEAQGIVPPPPTQSLSGSRLNIARRMLRRAETILTSLEDPEGTRTRDSPTEEPHDDITPVFAAQVFVPNAGTDALAAAVSAVENGIMQDQAAAVPTPSTESTSEPSGTPMNVEQNQEGQEASSQAGNSQQSRPGARAESTSSTTEMARLLDDLNRVQTRLGPFMERFRSFMAEDPVITDGENVRQTQNVINRVSEIMHLLGHAHHSLSDVMVQVNQPPPRPLLCRPILIQHSAVLQAGIPIQVEAQINLAPDRRPNESTTNSTPQQNTTATADSTTPTTAPTSQPTSESSPRPQPTISAQQIRPNVHEIRIDSFPIDIRNISRQAYMNFMQHAQERRNNNNIPRNETRNNNNVPRNEGQTPPADGAAPTGPQGNAQRSGTDPVVMPPMFANNINPNMEFFMEVTPGRITIDSLESTVVTSAAQVDNVLQGAFGGAAPEFIQSILHAVAGQMMGGAQQPAAGATPPTESTTPSSETSQTQESSTTTPPTSATGTNTQARSNTQTHPTTATQTRSTARPHVHLAQHSMQGFDPFLPCNSHHIRRRRGQTQNAAATQAAPAPEGETQNNNQQPNPLYSILQGFLRTVGNHVGRMQRDRPAQQETSNTSTAASNSGSQASSNTTPQEPMEPLPPFSTFLESRDLSPLARAAMDREMRSTNIASLLQTFPDTSYVAGENIISDLLVSMAHYISLDDILVLRSGQRYPTMVMRPALMSFFRNRVLQGECPTQPRIERGANRIIDELMPVLQFMESVPVRDDIDLVQSIVQLFRCRFPSFISLLMSRMSRSPACLMDQCILTMRHLCGLIMYYSVDGRRNVEKLFRSLINHCLVGFPSSVVEWAEESIMAQLNTFLSTLDVPQAFLEPYIVRRSGSRATDGTDSASNREMLNQLSRIATDETMRTKSFASLLLDFPNHNYVEGENLITDVIMTLAHEVSYEDVIELRSGRKFPMKKMWMAVTRFFDKALLPGQSASQTEVENEINKVISELMIALNLLESVPVRENVDLVQSIVQLLRRRFPIIIASNLCTLMDECVLTLKHICALIMRYAIDGRSAIETLVRSLRCCIVGISPVAVEWAIENILAEINPFLATLDVRETTLEPYIVRRSGNRATDMVMCDVEDMEYEETPVMETAPTASIPATITTADMEPLPNVVIGSEPWHSVTPTDWIPIITRDIQKQRRQSTQPAFSDAYLSGMPSKRRKIVQGNKPQGNVAQVIQEGVRRAIAASGLSNAAPVDTVAQAASSDLNLQTAYRELLRSRVQSSLRQNPDFTPERFPNASNFFNVK